MAKIDDFNADLAEQFCKFWCVRRVLAQDTELGVRQRLAEHNVEGLYVSMNDLVSEQFQHGCNLRCYLAHNDFIQAQGGGGGRQFAIERRNALAYIVEGSTLDEFHHRKYAQI